MSKEKNIFKGYKLFIITMCLCLSTGCSKATDDGNKTSEETTNTETANTVSIDELEIPDGDRIESTITDPEGNVFARIEANVILDRTTDFPVVTLKKASFTEEDIKTYADAFFDNGEYRNLRYIDEYTVSEIDDIIDIYKGYKQEIDDNKESMSNLYYDDASSYVDRCISSYVDLRAKASESVPLRCSTSYEKFDFTRDVNYYIDEYSLFMEEYKYCVLEGLHNGVEYTMTFSKDVESDITYLEVDLTSPETLVWGDYTYNQISCDSISRQIEPLLYGEGENECKYSKQDAIYLCNDIMNTFKIKDMAVIAVNDIDATAYLNRCTATHTVREGKCGYDVVYGKTINSTSMNYNISNMVYNIWGVNTVYDNGAPYRDGSETLICSVMDSGVVAVKYGLPTVVDTISSESTPLLAFDNVMSIFENRMIEAYGSDSSYKTENSNIVISKIQLELFRITVDPSKGEYALIPVWNFYWNEYYPMITINAIDGSIIDSQTGNAIE